MDPRTQQPGEDQFSRLVNPAKLDAERWKPMVYALSIDVPVIANGIGRGFVQINEQALFLTRASVMILGNTMDPETSGLYQDGLKSRPRMHHAAARVESVPYRVRMSGQ
jgi:hypothetical protein